jgi:membrane protease YdiL (CAAX protease family)
MKVATRVMRMRTEPVEGRPGRASLGLDTAVLKCGAVLAAPAAVPLSMAAVFGWLSGRLPPRTAYNVGFAIYWLGWCIGFPLLMLGPRRAARLLSQARRPSRPETLLLLLPVAGAVSTELLPNRKQIDGSVAVIMAATGALNATGEELLWRGVFLERFPGDVVRGLLWPLVGFSFWHLAPQMILPSRMGRWRFVLGSIFVGAVSAVSAWRSGGLRNCLVSHILTDSCGVTAARFRLGSSMITHPLDKE